MAALIAALALTGREPEALEALEGKATKRPNMDPRMLESGDPTAEGLRTATQCLLSTSGSVRLSDPDGRNAD